MGEEVPGWIDPIDVRVIDVSTDDWSRWGDVSARAQLLSRAWSLSSAVGIFCVAVALSWVLIPRDAAVVSTVGASFVAAAAWWAVRSAVSHLVFKAAAAEMVVHVATPLRLEASVDELRRLAMRGGVLVVVESVVIRSRTYDGAVLLEASRYDLDDVPAWMTPSAGGVGP